MHPLFGDLSFFEIKATVLELYTYTIPLYHKVQNHMLVAHIISTPSQELFFKILLTSIFYIHIEKTTYKICRKYLHWLTSVSNYQYLCTVVNNLLTTVGCRDSWNCPDRPVVVFDFNKNLFFFFFHSNDVFKENGG